VPFLNEGLSKNFCLRLAIEEMVVLLWIVSAMCSDELLDFLAVH